MIFRRRFFWVILAIFALISVFFYLFFVKKDMPKNNISTNELREAKKQFQLHILRYEKDLFSLDVNRLAIEIEQLSKIYPPWLIEPEVWNDPAMLEQLKSYLQDTVIIALYEQVEKTVNFDLFVKELETAFGYYTVFYPHDSIPEIITMIPGFDLEMPSLYMVSDDILLINIDMYLGVDCHYYKDLNMPMYIAERCDPIYLPVDIFKKAIVYKHLAKAPRTTLLEAMITEGKKLYFTEMMLPHLHERFIVGYSEEKYDWANDYIGNVWNYMIEKNELFGKGEALMRNYIEEAPFTKPFGNNSPGRMGIFLGWKLIQSYMTNHPELTLPELMEETDYQKILNTAKFKPSTHP
jgi:hypothetical protein